jgi:hypothetical protein
MRHFKIGLLVNGLALSSLGCSDSQTSFRSVGGTSEVKSSDANGEAAGPDANTEGIEDSSASQMEPTTVIVGDSASASESQGSSVMTISMGEDTGGESLSDATTTVDASYDTDATSSNASDDDSANSSETSGTTNGTDNQSSGSSDETLEESITDSSSTGEHTADSGSAAGGSSSGSGETGTATESSTNPSIQADPSIVSEKVIFECTGRKDVSAQKIKVVSSKNSGLVTVRADQYLFIHATGNRPYVKLNTENAENTKIRGICIFASGNQARIEANIGINVDAFSYFGTGNKSSGVVNVSESVSIGSLKVKLRGNQAKLTISGPGTFDCGSSNFAGNKPSFVCGN